MRRARVLALLLVVLPSSLAAEAPGEESWKPPVGAPVYSGIGGVTDPVIVPESRVAPVYPEKGRRKHVEAQCILQPVILKDGSVGPMEVLRCTLRFKDGSMRVDVWPRQNDAFGFAQASYDAAKQWRFKPATLNDEAVDAFFTVVVTFVLDQKTS